MKHSGRWLLLLCLLASPPSAHSQQEPARPPVQAADLERLLRTDYYGVYMMGQKVGWARTSVTRREGREPVYVYETEVSGKVMALGVQQVLQLTQTEEFDARPPYAFRGGFSRHSDEESVAETRLTRSGTGFEVVQRTGGETVRKQIAPLDYSLAEMAGLNRWVRSEPKVGESLTVRSFDYDRLRTERQIHQVSAAKAARADGVRVNYLELKVTYPEQRITSLERYDPKEGLLLSIKLAGLFEMRLESEQVAKKTEVGADLFELGKVKVDKKLGDPSSLAGLILEVTTKQELHLKSGPSQSVTKNPSGTYTLKLGGKHGVPVKATDEEIKEHLSESATYPISHAKVQALAKEAVGNAKTDEEKVQRLITFVANYIKPSYSAQPLAVMDVIKQKKGDCTEFALLFTTLARAAGVPTREVGGLVYMGDEDQAFGLHAWNEVVLKGHWVPVDASWGETEVNPTHICFGVDLGDQALNMFAAFSKMSFRVVELRRGK